ncbi:MAG: TIGR03067 domain-containing protein [Planctomycetaceae bacterium]|nr:TIGR03067 domain-containing protein [Planctomycetaceae bacterium]
MRHVIRGPVAVLLAAALAPVFTAPAAFAQRPTPVMEYASVLNSLDVYPNGLLQLEGSGEALTAVFLPQGAAVEAVLTKKGSSVPVHTQDFYINHVTEVFASVQARGKYREFRFTEPGDYLLTFRTGQTVMTQVPFTVFTESSDDVFNPQTAWFMKGPWNDWAYGYSKLSDGKQATVEFRMWGKRVSFEGATVTDKYTVELRKDGDVVAVGRTGYVSTQKWQPLRFELELPENKGGRKFQVEQLAARDGDYHFVVRRNGELHAVYPLKMQSGKPQLHPRQASAHKPRTEYMVPRYAGLAARGTAGELVWMKRLDAAQAIAIASGTPAAVAGPSAEQRAAWTWLPQTADPNRPFQLVVTDIETRSDTHIAAGDEIIAFGTGFPTGVKYLQVGDTKPREIPNGEVYNAQLFHVCGRKIVLVKKTQVVVFDTQTGKTVEIPETEISLYNPTGGLHRANLLNADGYLVAAVNRVDRVTDGNILKVIDVSGEMPVVIPIRNAGYNDRQVSSVAVDAANGLVAVSSAEKKLIGIAKVARLAGQTTFDMTDYRGVDRRQIFVEGRTIVYADGDRKVRLLQAGNPVPQAITEEAVGSSGNGFTVRKGRLVVATQQKFGTRFEMALSDLPERPLTSKDTGTPIASTSGKLGMAGCAAIALDRTVFIAGTPSGGVGKGEHLQMLADSGTWQPVLNEQGVAVSAIDVTTSIGLLAFKSADRDRRVTVAFATYGQRVSSPAAATASAGTTPTGAAGTGRVSGEPLVLATDNIHHTADEHTHTLLAAHLENEQQIMEAYTAAFGEKQAAVRTVDSIVQAMKGAGQESLVQEYKRVSKLVPDDQRPAAAGTQVTQPVDVQQVQAALRGEWKAARFCAQGQDLPDAAIADLTVTFAAGRYVMNTGRGIQTGTYDIDTTVSPMALTIHIGSGEHRGQDRHGRFKLLKGNQLLMVFGTSPESRPEQFVPDASGASILAAYQRAN